MGSLHYTSETQLIAALKKRDHRSFELLYDRYGAPIYHIIRKCVPSGRESEELFRTAIAEIWKNIQQFSAEEHSFFSWALAITGKIVQQHIRQQQTPDTAAQSSASSLPMPDTTSFQQYCSSYKPQTLIYFSAIVNSNTIVLNRVKYTAFKDGQRFTKDGNTAALSLAKAILDRIREQRGQNVQMTKTTGD